MAASLRIVLIAVFGVIVLLGAVTAYFLHDPDRYLPEAIAYIHEKTGKQIEIGHVTVNIFPLTVHLYDVGIKNPKPFPSGYFFKAPAVEAAIEVGPLLRQKIEIKKLVLDHPTIDVISDPDGLWNFQNPGTSKQQPTRFSMGSISKLEIKDGVLLGSALIDPSDKPGPVILAVQNFSAQLKQIDFHALKNPGAAMVVKGNLQADTAQFGDIHLKNLRSRLWVQPKQLTFKDLSAKTYRGEANGDFRLNFAGKNTAFSGDLKETGIGVAYLLAEFEKGPPKVTGMMQGDLKIAGVIEHTANPFAEINGSGHFAVSKGEFPSLNDSKSVAEMKRFRDPAAAALPISAFSSFTGDMELKNRHIYSRQIGIDFYGIDVDGSGNLDEVSGSMDYHGTANILKKQGFFVSTFARMFKGAKEKEGRLVFPIRVAGTLQNPRFSIVD